MSLITYDDARPWAKSIKQQVSTRTMPPFHARAPIGHFLDDPRLTDEEIALVVQWVDQGSRPGDPADMPEPLHWESEWRMGVPDIVLRFPEPYRITPDMGNEYVAIDLNYEFKEDTWLRAIEFRPDNLNLVHHANLHLVPRGEERIGPGEVLAGTGLLEQIAPLKIFGYLPGVGAKSYPEGTGVFVPAGSRLAMEIHYAPTDEEAYDQSSIAFQYANGVLNRRLDGHLAYPINHDVDFVLLPGDPNYEIIETREITEDALITVFQAHMHLRGKSYKVLFHYPNGDVETVFEIPKYDFNWQREYRLSKPFTVPRGTVAEHILVLDNSDANPLNPDPTQTVRWGWNTTDEMVIGALHYEVSPPDFKIRVVNGVAIPDTSSARRALLAVLAVIGLLLLAAFSLSLLIGNTRRKLPSDLS